MQKGRELKLYIKFSFPLLCMAAYNEFQHNLLPKMKPKKLGNSVIPAELAQ